MNNLGYQLITFTYNHERCILRHLNSIKAQIIEYGKEVYLTIIDDCSSDRNILIIKKWINTNKSLFIQIDFKINEKNLGIKETYLSCLKEIKFQKVKILAGDDLYIGNIFQFLDFSATKPIVFSPSAYLINNVLLPKVELNLHLSKSEITNLILKGQNPFSAPGVYINPKIITNDFMNYLSNHGDIFREDLPSWYYFIVLSNTEYYIYDFPVTIYIPSFINSESINHCKLTLFILHTFTGSQLKKLKTIKLKLTSWKKKIRKQLDFIDSL
jgi:hypothetical protein